MEKEICTEMNVLDILDEDAWREVLDRMKDPQDLKACSETCLVFEKILWGKKSAFLFDLILPEIVDYLPDIRKVGGDDGVEPYEEHNWQAFFNCRAVCKDWCKSIDRFEETNPLIDGTYLFDSGEKTEQFLQKFEAHDGNPIIGRNVTIVHRSHLLMAQPQEDNQNEDVPYDEIFHVTKIRQLLNRFGNEIWTLDLIEEYIQEGVYDHLALCKNIQTMLSRLPNLRNLQVKSSPDRLRKGHLLESVDQDQRRGMNRPLSAYISKHPLPHLPHLESLKVPGLNLIVTRLILEKHSSQLKRLAVNWHPNRFSEQLPRFSCLRELTLQYLDAKVPLQCLRQLHSPLEKLSLMIRDNIYKKEVWRIDDFFRSIQHLLIRDLEIINDCNDLFLGESVPTSREFRVLHESIYTVNIICVRGPVSLNLLAYCPNLAVLSVLHRCSPREFLSRHPKGVFELFNVWALIKKNRHYDLYQSDIWKRIRSLKKITVGKYSGFREALTITGKYMRRRSLKMRKMLQESRK